MAGSKGRSREHQHCWRGEVCAADAAVTQAPPLPVCGTTPACLQHQVVVSPSPQQSLQSQPVLSAAPNSLLRVGHMPRSMCRVWGSCRQAAVRQAHPASKATMLGCPQQHITIQPTEHTNTHQQQTHPPPSPCPACPCCPAPVLPGHQQLTPTALRGGPHRAAHQATAGASDLHSCRQGKRVFWGGDSRRGGRSVKLKEMFVHTRARWPKALPHPQCVLLPYIVTQDPKALWAAAREFMLNPVRTRFTALDPALTRQCLCCQQALELVACCHC